MKRQFFALLAASLITVGILADRAVTLLLPQPSAVAAGTTSTTANTSVPASTIDQTMEQAYATASQAVVYVESKGVGSGSGIIYDKKGDIVTNYHVISGANSLSVTLNNGKTYTATVLGTDQADDLAVIHISASHLTPAHFASAGSYQVAETVLAIGSPLGLKQSVTSGLISGLHRVEQEPNGAYIANAIQTSAPINPGNSGGALVTLDGTVVGVPTMVQTSSSDGTTTQNIGFAVPSERVTLIAKQIIATGKVEHTGRAYLGLAPTDATSQSSSGFGLGPRQTAVSGALVARVSANGPAGKAGVQQGDVITGVDGTSITDTNDLLTTLAGKKPGDTITLKLDRNGTNLSIQVRLGEMPA